MQQSPTRSTDLVDVRRLVVIATCPADIGGARDLVAQAHGAQVQVYIVLLTTGGSRREPDHHAATTQRLAELDAAVDALAPGSPVVFLAAPAGGVADVEDEVVEALGEIVGGGQGTLLVAPMGPTHDHDHAAAARAAARVAAGCAARLVGQPAVVPSPREGGRTLLQA